MTDMHWLEKLEPVRKVSKYVVETGSIVQPGTYGAKILGFGAVFGYATLKLADSLFGQKMDGTRVKKENVFPPFRPFFDLLYYNRFDDDPKERWKSIFHRAFVGSGFVAGAYFGARDFFKNYPSQSILTEYKAPDGKNFNGLTAEMIEKLIAHGNMDDVGQVAAITGGLSVEKAKEGLGQFLDHHTGFKMDRLMRVILGNHAGPSGAFTSAMGGGSGVAYTPLRSSVFNGIQYVFGAEWQVSFPWLGKLLTNSGNVERGGGMRQIQNAFNTVAHNLQMLTEHGADSEIYQRALKEIENSVDGAVHPQFMRSAENKSEDYKRFVQNLSQRIVGYASRFKDEYMQTMQDPKKHQAVVDKIAGSLQKEFSERSFFGHVMEAQRATGFVKSPKVELGFLGSSAKVLSKISQHVFGMEGNPDEINNRLDLAWRTANKFSGVITGASR